MNVVEAKEERPKVLLAAVTVENWMAEIEDEVGMGVNRIFLRFVIVTVTTLGVAELMGTVTTGLLALIALPPALALV